ncbi:hypothetical protein Patl1_29413 [Pistacia atlantica]|uniref:Uncharacterized protein n=1 Tax=Pistacia atlantica TaxID=434234 RepID=A0ACC1ADG1_9ROSI|nr:hypothetical protein Patl1_29413 [Pistacia atlantica]
MFSVMRQAPKLITPASSTPRVIKKVSDIDDQEGLRHHVQFLFFYKNNPSPAMKGKDPVQVIREPLSRALVFYCPLAGRLKEAMNRKFVVDWTGEGVLFIEADANVKLEHFGDEIQVPCPYLNQLLYKVLGSEGIVDCPLLSIQVTRLVCGGFNLGLRFNHAMCDGFGLQKFAKAVEEMTRDDNENVRICRYCPRQAFQQAYTSRISWKHHCSPGCLFKGGRFVQESIRIGGRSSADYMVIKERPKCSTEGNFFISDLTPLGFEEVDLGWGQPIYAGPTEATSFISYCVKYIKRD